MLILPENIWISGIKFDKMSMFLKEILNFEILPYLPENRVFLGKLPELVFGHRTTKNKDIVLKFCVFVVGRGVKAYKK